MAPGIYHNPHVVQPGYLKVDYTAEPDSHAMLQDPTLTHLDFSNGYLREIDTLSQALIGNATLTTLDLSHNDISGPTVKSLADALAVNAGLTTLRLSHNPHNPYQGMVLGEALKTNSTLTELDLRGGHRFCIAQGLDDKGVESLAKGLIENTSLTTLNLENNHLTPASAVHLALALDVNTTLTTLKFQDWKEVGPDDVIASINAKLQRNLENKVFNSFTVDEKNSVYQNILELSSCPPGDPLFGENNVFKVDRGIFKQAIVAAGIDLDARIEEFKKA